jgi:hypothetical protein
MLGMPAHQLDLESLVRFVLDCSLDNRTTGENVSGRVAAMGKREPLFERLLMRFGLMDRLKITTLALRNRMSPSLATDMPQITAIRLELLTDAKLPAGGPGRAGNGNLVLNDFRAVAASKADPAKSMPLSFARVSADSSERSGDAAKTGPVVVSAASVPDYLGPPRFRQDVSFRVSRPGVATGVAWTETGGDVLYIEATLLPGERGMRLTGRAYVDYYGYRGTYPYASDPGAPEATYLNHDFGLGTCPGAVDTCTGKQGRNPSEGHLWRPDFGRRRGLHNLCLLE